MLVEIVLLSILVVIFLSLLCVVNTRYFHILQQNHYDTRSTIKFFRSDRQKDFTLQLIVVGIIDFLMFSIVNDVVISCGWGLLYFVCAPLLLFSVYVCKYNKSSVISIKYTKRMIRLICVNIFVTLLSILILLGLSYHYFGSIKYAILGVIMCIDPLLCILSNLAIKPVEMMIAYYLKSKTKKIVKKHSSHIKIIAITGSYGKTTIKNILYNILSEKYKVCVTPKNYNTPMGISYTVSNLDCGDDILLLEYGADHVGDITELCHIAQPDISILCGIGPQHLSTFGSMENIVNEKTEILKYAKECVVYSSDSPYYEIFKCKNDKAKNIVIGKDIVLLDYVYSTNMTRFRCKIDKREYEFETSLLGLHNIENLMFAIATSIYLGISIDSIKKGIAKTKSVSHRLERKYLSCGAMLLDDSYNINIKGALSALDTLSMFDGNKIVITSGIIDNLENISKNNQILAEKTNSVCDVVFIVSHTNYDIMSQYIDKNKVVYVDRIENIDFSKFTKNDVILLQSNLPDNYEV